jgi:hypothetical protein
MSSAFPILDPLNIELSFTSVYPIPEAGTILTLRFGVTGDIEIVSSSSNVVIGDSGSQISVMTVILSEDSEIVLKSSSSNITIIIEIDSENSEIKISSNSSLVEHLPDIEIAGSEIIINLSESIISGGQANDLPGYVRTGDMGFIWNNVPEKVESGKSFFWNEPDDLLIKEKIAWDKTTNTDKKTTSPFLADMIYFDFKNIVAYSNFQNKPDFKNTASFLSKMIFMDEFHSHLWGEFFIRDHDAQFPYDNFKWFEFRDTRHFTLFDKSEPWNRRFENKFDNGNDILADNHHGTYWGPYWYSLWCQEKYFPYVGNEEVHLVLKSDFPNLIHPEFLHPNNPRCPFDYWYSGGRDSFTPDIEPIEQKIVPKKKVYYMINTAYIKRLPDNADIPFSNISISIDRDSWVWDFSIDIINKETLEMLKPQGNVFIDIQIFINGWEWTCKIENWSENISFDSNSWRVSGRSPSVEIGEPYNVEPLFQNQEKHGGQIITDILQYSNWDFQWHYNEFNPFTQWLIPENLINLTDVSKISQIKHLTNAVNAFVQTNADTYNDPKLHIYPKYKENPWVWNTSITSEYVLNPDICHESSRSNEIIKPINAVIVSSQNKGVIVNAVKNGTAGDSAAPLEINALATTQEAGKEIARQIMGSSGFWINHTYTLFSLMPPNEAPGLLTPGMFIDMNEGNGVWTGQVTSTSVSATWNDRSGLIVNQTIDVEQFYE